MDGLVAKIRAAIGKSSSAHGEGDDGDEGRGPPRSVPYHRFREERDARKALASELGDLGAQVEALRGGYDASLAKLREDTAGEVTGIQARHNEDIGLIGAGFRDPLDRQTLRTAFEAQPKSTRGKNAGEWWDAQTVAHAAHIADPETIAAPSIPRPLTPYLPAPEAAPVAAAEPASNGWGSVGGPPPGPGRREPQSVDSVPVDQGMGAFFAGLRGLSGGPEG